MTLLFLALLLVGPDALLAFTAALGSRVRVDARTAGRLGLSLLLVATGLSHFLQSAAMAGMVPAWVPLRLELIYATGAIELLAAAALWFPATARPAGLLLITMFVALLPANVYAAVHRVPVGGHEHGPAYLLVRIPFQALLIVWTYRVTNQAWWNRLRRRRGRS